MNDKTRKVRRRKRPLFRLLYRAVVLISLLIVVGYCAWQILVPAPVVPPLPAAAQTDDPSTPDTDESLATPTPLVRRDMVYTFLLAASDDGNGNADTIMAVTFDVPAQTVGVVSIPRDTIVDTDRKSPKLNAAYGKGAEVLQTEVSKLVGIPVDYYITLDMAAFVALIDEVGGIYFDVPIDMDYDDPLQDLAIHYTAGMQHLNGQQALEVARFRKNNDGSGYPDSDVSRTKTQQKILMATAKKVLSFSSVPKFNRFLDIFTRYVDTNLTANEIAFFASAALSVDLDAGVSFATLPGDGSAVYRGYSWCYALYPEECLAIFNDLLNPYTTPITQDVAHILTP